MVTLEESETPTAVVELERLFPEIVILLARETVRRSKVPCDEIGAVKRPRSPLLFEIETFAESETSTWPTLLDIWMPDVDSMLIPFSTLTWETSTALELVMSTILLEVIFATMASLTKAVSTMQQMLLNVRLLILTPSQFATMSSPTSTESTLSPEQSL